jgi:hypothetical protein
MKQQRRHIYTHNIPDQGRLFTVDLPRFPTPALELWTLFSEAKTMTAFRWSIQIELVVHEHLPGFDNCELNRASLARRASQS